MQGGRGPGVATGDEIRLLCEGQGKVQLPCPVFVKHFEVSGVH